MTAAPMLRDPTHAPVPARCGAKTRGGEPCRRAPIVGGNGRCYMHNGRAATGMAASGFKTGKYSRYLPARLLERYAESERDADLLALRGDIALVDARLADLLTRVDTGESGAVWRALSDAWAALRLARAAKDAAALNAALAEVGALIERAGADSAAWREIHAAVDQRRKLVESERKRLVEMQQMVTAEQAMTFVAALAESVRRNVSDPRAVAAISADLARFTRGAAGA